MNLLIRIQIYLKQEITQTKKTQKKSRCLDGLLLNQKTK